MSPSAPTNVDGQQSAEATRTEPPTLEFKRLSADCRRGAFSCGQRDIDKWFKDKSFKHHQTLRTRVVTAHLLDNPNPVGFYALTMKLEPESLLERDKRLFSLSEGGYFPTVQLSWIAVQKQMQRKKLGTVMMGAVLGDFYEVAVRTGVYALTLVAINQDVANFYKGLGFVPYGPDSATPKLLLPSKSVIEMAEQTGA
jgi:GNAT superfamily N-acetyltransferase